MILLKNGRIFDGRNIGAASEDLLLKDGVVAGRGKDLSGDGAEVFDLGGKLLCPGFIDLHVHFRDPGYEWRVVGDDLVLIALSTAIVTSVINGVFK